MNEITYVPQDEAQIKSDTLHIPSTELQARIDALQAQMNRLQNAAKEGGIVPEGMVLHRAVLSYFSSDSVNGGSEYSRYYSGAYILLPKEKMEFVVVPQEGKVSINGIEESSIKSADGSIQWIVVAGGVKIHDRTDYYADTAADTEAVAEPQLYEGPDGISTPFAVGLSPEEAVMAYKAAHADSSEGVKRCETCGEVGGYCGPHII